MSVTQAQVLKVLDDLIAEQNGELSPETRRWVADRFPQAKVAGPWEPTPWSPKGRYRRCTGTLGDSIAEVNPVRAAPYHGGRLAPFAWRVYLLGGGTGGEGRAASMEEAQDFADGWLVLRGWILQ